MEPLRPFFIDRLVLQLINREQITPSDFEPSEEGQAVWLTPAGREKFFAAYETFFDGGPEKPLDAIVSGFKHALVQNHVNHWNPNLPAEPDGVNGFDCLHPFDPFQGPDEAFA